MLLDELVDRCSSLVLATHLIEGCQLKLDPVAEDEPKCVGLLGIADGRSLQTCEVVNVARWIKEQDTRDIDLALVPVQGDRSVCRDDAEHHERTQGVPYPGRSFGGSVLVGEKNAHDERAEQPEPAKEIVDGRDNGEDVTRTNGVESASEVHRVTPPRGLILTTPDEQGVKLGERLCFIEQHPVQLLHNPTCSEKRREPWPPPFSVSYFE